MSLRSHRCCAFVLICCVLSTPGMAADGVVKVTPLGSHDGEFCRYDRALLFEDPNGTRVLYDAGRTVAGGADPRLGTVDIILVSHLHGDHVGDRHIAAVNAGECGQPQMPVAATPGSNSVAIALAKKAKIVTGSEMPKFFATRLAAGGGDEKDAKLVRFGGTLTIAGVTITTVPAAHSNGIAPNFIGGTLGDMLQAAGITAYAGPPTGYVVSFSNGLVVYLSGDTGITAEQRSVVHDHYAAELAVINIGDTFTTGPDEAAHVINQLVQPATVIASHANEAATQQGRVIDGTRTARFVAAAQVPVVVPLSGATYAFDAQGRCVEGCR